jgi:VWFA-related protein
MRRLYFVFLLTLAAYSQQAPQPETKISVEVRRVPVDVIVTDSHDRPLLDLTREDFEIFEDKQKQELTGFYLEHQEPATAPSVRLPAGFVSNSSILRGGDLTVILFDELNTRFQSLNYARTEIETFLKNERLRGRQVALVALNGDLIPIHEFTTEPAMIIEAFKRHRTYLPQVSSGTGRAPLVRRAELTLAALQLISQSLRYRPGRKRLLWFSEGFPVSFTDGGVAQSEGALVDAVRAASVALTTARVSVYPIGPSGISAADSFGPLRDNRFDNSVTMLDIAEQTGGRFFKNASDLVRVGLEAMNDGDTYYAFSYRPADSKPGKYRRIEVKVKRDGARVRFRHGYWEETTDDAKTRTPVLRSAALEPFLRNELTFAATAFKEKDAIRVTLILSPKSLELPADPADTVRKFQVIAVERNETMKPEISKPEDVELRIQSAQFERVRAGGLPVRVTLPTKGKADVVRVLLFDTETGKIGTLDIPLQTAARS